MTAAETPAAVQKSRQQWLFNQEELRRTPSSQAGHSMDREKTERMKGCDFILKVGMKLRLPQTTIATACVFLHRFYMRFPLREYHHYDIAATSLFLATKCEETGRKLSDIVIACAKTAVKNDSAIIDEQSKDYWRWRDVILYNEELLLEALCFDLVVEHPYSQLKAYWRQFGAIQDLAKTAWCVANDTFRTSIVLMFDTNTIAVACLYYASVFSNLPLPQINGKDWFEIVDVDMVAVLAVITSIVELYESAQQIAKDGFDPKALAKAGTEAHQKLEENLKGRAQCEPELQPEPLVNGNDKRTGLNGSNGTSKRLKVEEEATIRPNTASSEGEVKELEAA